MSSILDALRKLEDEQRQVKEMREIDPHEAAHELVSPRTPRPVSAPQPLNPQTLYLTLGAFAVGAVCLSVVVTTMLLRDHGSNAPQQTPVFAATPAAAEPRVSEPVQAEPVQAASVQAQVTPPPAPSAIVAEEEAEAPEETAALKPVELERQAPVEEPMHIASAKPTPAPKPDVEPVRAEPRPQAPVRTEPAPEPQPTESSRPVDLPSRQEEPESAPLPSFEEVQKRLADARKSLGESPDRAWDSAPKVESTPLPEPSKPIVPEQLPILSPAAKAQHGLDGLMVNMLSPASPTKPRASAIISNMKVFVGERINSTRAKLVQVEPDGVVIEIAGTGEQYFLAQ